MRTVSNNFRKVINQGGPFYAYAEVTLADDTEFTLNSTDDFYFSGNKYNHSFSNNFPIGEAICKTITLKIYNTNDKYSAVDFDGAVIKLYTEVDVTNNTSERLLEGIFNVSTAKIVDNILEIVASDNMVKADILLKARFNNRTLSNALTGVCSQCGLNIADTNFRNSALSVYWNGLEPGDATCREIIGYIAQIAGGNAIINPNGELMIKSYDFPSDESVDIISGRNLTTPLTDYISGGTFGDTTSDIINSGEFGNTDNDYKILNRYQTPPKTATKYIRITGVSMVDAANKTHQYGSTEYNINVLNKLAGKPRTVDRALPLIGESIVGKAFFPFSGKFPADPTLELMDTVYVVDTKGTIYKSFLTSIVFNYMGSSELANEAPNSGINSTSYMPSYRNSGYSGNVIYVKPDNTQGQITVTNGLITDVT